MLKARIIRRDVYINNRLTSKPQQAVESLRKIIRDQAGYDLRLWQNYSKGVVHMQLEGVCLMSDPINNKTFHDVFGIQKVPITSNKKAYIKALRKMLGNPAPDPIMVETGTIAAKQDATKTKQTSFLHKIAKFFGNKF